MSALAPGLVPGAEPRPLECALCLRLSSTPQPPGAERGPVYRAIRALGARIFPGKSQAGLPRTGRTLIDRSVLGSNFRLVLGNPANSAQPCPAPGMPLH